MLTQITTLLSSVALAYAASGVSTFNNYDSQGGVACGGYHSSNSQGSGIYAAAMGDLSPMWTGPKCQGSMNRNNCNGYGGCTNCAGPACAGQGSCGKCYMIKCTGTIDGGSGSCSGKTIKVKVVDACPSSHPENYCKISSFGGNIAPDEACEASGVNAFDIATSARSVLSSYPGNLKIDIEGPVAC